MPVTIGGMRIKSAMSLFHFDNSEHEEIGTFMHKIGKGIYSGVITLEEFMEAKAQGWPCKDGSTPIEEEPIFKSLEEAQEAVKNGWPDNQ